MTLRNAFDRPISATTEDGSLYDAFSDAQPDELSWEISGGEAITYQPVDPNADYGAAVELSVIPGIEFSMTSRQLFSLPCSVDFSLGLSGADYEAFGGRRFFFELVSEDGVAAIVVASGEFGDPSLYGQLSLGERRPLPSFMGGLQLGTYGSVRNLQLDVSPRAAMLFERNIGPESQGVGRETGFDLSTTLLPDASRLYRLRLRVVNADAESGLEPLPATLYLGLIRARSTADLAVRVLGGQGVAKVERVPVVGQVEVSGDIGFRAGSAPIPASPPVALSAALLTVPSPGTLAPNAVYRSLVNRMQPVGLGVSYPRLSLIVGAAARGLLEVQVSASAAAVPGESSWLPLEAREVAEGSAELLTLPNLPDLKYRIVFTNGSEFNSNFFVRAILGD